MKHDQQLFPTKALTEQGYPRWEGSLAQRYLKADLKNKERDITPSELHNTRDEYKKFPLKVF